MYHSPSLVLWLGPLVFVGPCLDLLVTLFDWELKAFILLFHYLGPPAQGLSDVRAFVGNPGDICKYSSFELLKE